MPQPKPFNTKHGLVDHLGLDTIQNDLNQAPFQCKYATVLIFP
jgi:hypothetical protein